MLQETSRILHDDGVFIGSCYHEGALDKRLQLYNEFENIIKSVNEYGHVKFKKGIEADISCQYRQEEIVGHLNQAGFKVEKLEKSGPFYLFKAIKR